MAKLTHFDEQGASRMVDVGQSHYGTRSRASATVRMLPETARLVEQGTAKET